jgi:carbon monoxide dehydrogenase subunit G
MSRDRGTVGCPTVLIHEAFTVPRSVDEVWTFLLDVERVAPCLPGAALTDTLDETHWKGLVQVKFGPVAMTFRGSVELQERDDVAHRVQLSAKGTEQRGKGAANATVTALAEPTDAGTVVSMDADITLSGAAAQLSRGLLPEVSKQLTASFAECLRRSLENAPPGTARTVGGVRLGVRAALTAFARWLRRMFAGRTGTEA